MSVVAPDSPASTVETAVRRIRELLERGQFAVALAAAEVLARAVPENRDVLYMAAVSLRNLARIPDALTALERLQGLHPGFSRLYQERGHCYVALRDAPRAIEAFLVAVNMNPALPASWRTLQSLFQMTGQPDQAAMAGAHVATLAKLPPEIVTATSMFSDGEFALAEAVVRPFLLKHGDHIEGMRLLARIGLELDVLDDAEFLLEAVLAVAPDYTAARHDYAKVLLRRHKPAQALTELERLLAGEPGNRHYRTSYATALVGLGHHERALALHRELLAETPRAAELHLSVAHSLKTLGRQPEAIEAYRAAAAVRPNYGDAYWSLANLKTYRFTPDEVARMRACETAAGTATVDRYHLCFALGKALEDAGDFGAAFAYYERGNALKKAETRYRPESIERNARLQAEVCTHEFFAARRGVGCDAADPIFIVGLPRSGSTLLEQILASHSAVEGTMELAEIPRIVQGLQGRESYAEARESDAADPRYPRILALLPFEEFARLGRRYLEETRIYRTARPRFIDKMPNNFRHLGLIHLMLPNARIIDARREPMACCFSNFKQLFASGQEFTYSIEDIARYYRSYRRLMAHWDEVLPGRILRIHHEDVVADLEGSVRRLLDFCDLPFEPACLDFHRTARSIRTASSEQVRRPIFREGLDQWHHFAPWLAPLREALANEDPAVSPAAPVPPRTLRA